MTVAHKPTKFGGHACTIAHVQHTLECVTLEHPVTIADADELKAILKKNCIAAGIGVEVIVGMTAGAPTATVTIGNAILSMESWVLTDGKWKQPEKRKPAVK